MFAMQIIKATAVITTMLLVVAATNIAIKIIRLNK
jgi:hypothetical protein